MPKALYDVLDLQYADGTPAVLRYVDGSGFVFYQSGRKAICLSGFGQGRGGGVRRFGAVIHEDNARGAVLGVFDQWGHGYADGRLNLGDHKLSKVMISDREVTVVDAAGQVTSSPMTPYQAHGAGSAMSHVPGSGDVVLHLSQGLSLVHRRGRTTLNFQLAAVSHTFVLGELHGDEVEGMPAVQERSLCEAADRSLGEVTQKLGSVCDLAKTLKVDPSQKDTKPAISVNSGNLQDVLDNLATLTQSLAHPNLAPPNLEWTTERRLKERLAAAHPRCPGQTKRNWSIARVGGRCTADRLENVPSTVSAPMTVALISQLQLPELIEECGSSGTVLVVICLATYAKDLSARARLIAEKAHAELSRRFDEAGSGGPPPVRLVAIELTEASGFAKRYGITEVPYCLIYKANALVISKRLDGGRIIRDGGATRPRVLLVEASPTYQLKVERALRRSGYESDLALDGPHAMQLASRQQAYGVLLVSALFRADQLRSTATAVRSLEPKAVVVAFNGGAPSTQDDHDEKRRFLDECTHVFPFLPSYTGLAAVLSRHEAARPSFPNSGKGKREFLEEILGVLDQGRGPQSPMAGSGLVGLEAN
mmetsp:Transcript_54423/g.117790  ORF Transcript_54423/g.117790 Transcript_54423/m.117790 type:complete len:593 (-) Transcript_54423:116-1894(-)